MLRKYISQECSCSIKWNYLFAKSNADESVNCILIHLPSRKHDSHFAFWELTHTRNKATTFTLRFQNLGIWKWVPRVWYPAKYLLSTRSSASTRSCNNFISSLPGLGKIWCKIQKQVSFSAKFWIDSKKKKGDGQVFEHFNTDYYLWQWQDVILW